MAGAAGAAQMPQWQRGLAGVMTGNPAYGHNAPYFNNMFRNGMGALQMGQQQPQMPQAQMGRPMQPQPSPGLRQFLPPQQMPPQQMQQPWMGGVPGQGAGPQTLQGGGMGQQQPSPWMSGNRGLMY